MEPTTSGPSRVASGTVGGHKDDVAAEVVDETDEADFGVGGGGGGGGGGDSSGGAAPVVAPVAAAGGEGAGTNATVRPLTCLSLSGCPRARSNEFRS